MVDQSRLHDALRGFVGILGGRYEIGEVLYQLTDQTVAVIGCTGAGVAIRNGGSLQFVTATHEPITRIEQRQIDTGQGPCQDAFDTGQVTTCADLQAESRWPDYRPEAVEFGARAVAGIPLAARQETIGALNLYWFEPHQPTGAELDAAGLLAEMAAAYVANLVVITDAERLNKQLHTALESRVVIEQAKGVLAERTGTEPAAAFERLRSHARSNQRRLHEVAADVVAGDLEL